MPVNKEQLTTTTATISCVVSGLTKKLDEVKWTRFDDTAISQEEEGYRIEPGVYDPAAGVQTTTLTVSAALNTQDTSYNCLVTSEEWAVEDSSSTVVLNVYCKY